ncbi:unnamed protein product [Ceutorhynchus assimilis]|uniref:Uncharacterized protein n=1 Tax=Ceutorhynchus assimilis TaxID=467358 RepID=A0A9N9MH89_9CUCU|nr:unnamed protein product [Ceutorhynchus assimilis]
MWHSKESLKKTVKKRPSLLHYLPQLICVGSAVHTECRASKPAVTICQLIMFNMLQALPKGNIIRHKKKLEPPLPIYLGLSIYARSRNKQQIDELHNLGISISSNRVMEITAQFSHVVVGRAEEEGVVCPSSLKKGLFTVAAIDNIDHNPSSTTSAGSFHGTGIFVFQLPFKEEEATIRNFQISFEDVANNLRSVPNLPDSFAVVPDYIFHNKQPAPSSCSEDIAQRMRASVNVMSMWHLESDWLSHIHVQMNELCEKMPQNISWSSFRSNEVKDNVTILKSISTLLPLFYEKSTSPAMIRHGMKIVHRITELLNGQNQPAVLCADQPLYAIIKTIQWNCPLLFGENKFVAMFGPLHIEQNFLKLLGGLLNGSGWVELLSNSGIISAGSAEAVLKVTHITKARLHHQYTVAVLYSLLQDAYRDDNPNEEQPFDDWVNLISPKSPTFQYWLLVMNLQILLLSFLRALRLGNFTEYTESLLRMIPWFFAFSHSNYARWISVHVKDLLELETKLPNVYCEFMLGNFVVHKSGCIFSAVGIDQAHEQNNALIKADGGAVGLLHDATALKRWMIVGPEISGLLSQFQENIAGVDKKGTHHHEQYSAFQKSFYEKCLALKESFIQAENPFKIRSEDLIALDTRMVADEEGVAALHGAETIGNDLFHEFIDRLVLAPTSLYSPIKKSNVNIFCFEKKKLVRVAPNQQLKSDAQLFSRLFIVSSSRRLDLDTFFEHENQSFPPAISVSGELRTGSKSTLVSILENLCREIQQPQPTSCDAVVYDGAALVHFLKPSPTIKLFSEYRAQVKSHIEVFCKNLKAERVDIAWDLYRDDSIKTTARQSRGTGARRQDLPNKGELPKKWDEYLKNSSNKVELFEYLAKGSLAETEELNVVTNVGVTLRASVPASSSLNEALCDQIEEADGRVILHLADMVQHGTQNIVVRCSDTDILVLAVSFFFFKLQSQGLEQLWILFGCGKLRRYIPANSIALTLGEKKATALRGFHAFSGSICSPPPSPCNNASKYRSLDGTCNNLEHPKWGASYTIYTRLLPANYADGISAPPVAKDGSPLPLARLVSSTVHPTAPVEDKQLTLNAMQYGQILTHYLNLVAQFNHKIE